MGVELIEDGSVFHKFEYSMDLKMTFEKIQGKIIGIWWDVQGENKNIDINKLRWFIAKHFCTEHNSEIKRSRSKQIREKKCSKLITGKTETFSGVAIENKILKLL